MPTPIEYRVSEIEKFVTDEFGEKASSFNLVRLRMDVAKGDVGAEAKKSGVYVLVHDVHGWIKVGKSQSNAYKRAREHFSANITVPKYRELNMSQLGSSEEMHMLIYALQDDNDRHWILALENYLERKLNLQIPSKRID